MCVPHPNTERPDVPTISLGPPGSEIPAFAASGRAQSIRLGSHKTIDGKAIIAAMTIKFSPTKGIAAL